MTSYLRRKHCLQSPQ